VPPTPTLSAAILQLIRRTRACRRRRNLSTAPHYKNKAPVSASAESSRRGGGGDRNRSFCLCLCCQQRKKKLFPQGIVSCGQGAALERKKRKSPGLVSPRSPGPASSAQALSWPRQRTGSNVVVRQRDSNKPCNTGLLSGANRR
jgi:hypothetical protein